MLLCVYTYIYGNINRMYIEIYMKNEKLLRDLVIKHYFLSTACLSELDLKISLA